MTAAPCTRWIPTSKANPCPVCGRTKDADCRTSKEGDQVICHHPRTLQPGELENGWAFTSNTSDSRAAHFVLDKPMDASRRRSMRVVPLRAAELQPAPPTAIPAVPLGPIQLLRLPEGAPDVVQLEKPGPIVQIPVGEDLVDYYREASYRYGPTQEVWRLVSVADGKKRFQARSAAAGRWIARQGPGPWQHWRGEEAITAAQANPGRWLLETEGEKAAEIAREGGLAAISQPGHAHKVEQIRARYRALVAAGVGGVVYLADVDMKGLERAQDALDAAAAEGLLLVVLPASNVWEDMPEGGSIDDGIGTPDERVASLLKVIGVANGGEWGQVWAEWRQAMAPPAPEPEVGAAVDETAGAEPQGAPVAPKAAKVTAEEVAAKLRQALVDGIEGTELELLIQELAQNSGQHPSAVQRLASSLEAEVTRQAGAAASVAAEAEQLRARSTHRQVGESITLAHLFPAPIAEALALRTRYLPANPCAVAVLFLPSIASLLKIGSRITGNPASGFTVPLNLWGAVVAKSGQKKSPLLRRVVLDPAAEVKQALLDGNRREQQQWQDSERVREKNDPKPDKPKPLRLHVNDWTGESLTAELVNCAERGRGLLFQRDELAGLFSGLNQYKAGSGNEGQFLLELFDGGGHTSLRISGAREFSESLVSITGCMQPPVLAELVNASSGDADGRYARFLFAPLTEPPKPLPVEIDPVEQLDIDRAGQYLQRVVGEVHRAPARQLHLDPEALKLFATYEHQQAVAADAATIAAQGAVLGKAAGKVLRVTGLLHLLDQIASGGADPVVGPDPLLRAIDLVEHLNGWILSLHAELASGGTTGLMRKLHDTAKALKVPLQWRKLRDRLTCGQKRVWDRDGFEAAAQALVELGVGHLEENQQGGPAYVAIGELP